MKKLFALLLLIGILISSCQNSSGAMESKPTIGTIQGCGHISPYNGEKVLEVEGVVTHKFKNGFTMQSTISDLLPCTSDAIFITTGIYPSVYPGQLVIVDGTVSEYTPGVEEDHNLSRTEIHDPSIKVIDENIALPQPIILGQSESTVPTKWIKYDNIFDIQKNGLDFMKAWNLSLSKLKVELWLDP